MDDKSHASMKQKLGEHLDTVLGDAPDDPRTRELRTELYQNMCDRYDDAIAEGRSPAAAYNAAVTGLGDISSLIEEDSSPVSATLVGNGDSEEETRRESRRAENRSAWKRYRTRTSILIPTAIVLYILSVIPVILLEDANENLGVVLMFSCVAVATGLLIFTHMSRPVGTSPASTSGKSEKTPEGDPKKTAAPATSTDSPRAKLRKTVSSVLWMVTVLAYLAISFLTMRWEITWLIFLIAIAADHILEALFDLNE